MEMLYGCNISLTVDYEMQMTHIHMHTLLQIPSDIYKAVNFVMFLPAKALLYPCLGCVEVLPCLP